VVAPKRPDSARRERTRTSLAAVRDRIVACERCPRLRTYCRTVAREKRRAYLDDTYWGRPVAGFGDPSARILLVGLAPAAHGANRTGRIFTGDGTGGSGDFLMAALHRTGFANRPVSERADDGLRLTDVYIAAAVRCAPPGNRPRPDEIARCLPHLEAEIDALPRLRVVVALGRIAFDVWLRVWKGRGVTQTPRPQFEHGAVVRPATLPDGLPRVLVGCYHPSRQNTHTGRLTATMLERVLAEAARLRR